MKLYRSIIASYLIDPLFSSRFHNLFDRVDQPIPGRCNKNFRCQHNCIETKQLSSTADIQQAAAKKVQ
jgi:hypothetical protein